MPKLPERPYAKKHLLYLNICLLDVKALTQLRDDNSPDDRFQKTKYTCFNPKAAAFLLSSMLEVPVS